MTENPIRAVREGDLAAFKAIRLEALRNHPEAFSSDYAERAAESDETWLGYIRKTLDGKKGQIFLAWDGDHPAAMLGVLRETGAKSRHSAFIWGVYVHPAFRGRGLTDRMLQMAIEWCASAEVTVLRLTVITSNGPAIRCYTRAGFAVCGVAPKSIRIGDVYHDELMMWRNV